MDKTTSRPFGCPAASVPGWPLALFGFGREESRGGAENEEGASSA